MKSLLRLWPYLKPHIGTIILSGFLALPLAALRVSPVTLIQYLIDEILGKSDPSKLILLPIAIIGISIFNFIFRFSHYYLIRKVIGKVNERLKNNLYNHLIGLSADYFSSQKTGTLVSRTASDPQYIDEGIASINMLIREPITFLLLMGYAFYLNWQLSLLMILIFPLLAWVFTATGKNIKRYVRGLTEENAQIFSNLQESFSGIRIVKTFGLENFLKEKFQSRTSQFRKMYMKMAVMQEASSPTVELLAFMAIAAMLYYGGAQVLDGNMTSGQLVAFFTSFALMINPIRLMNDVNIKIHQAAAAADRIFEVFSLKPTTVSPENPRHLSALEKGVAFENVSFAFPDEPQKKILNSISFEAPKGAVVALVGSSGAGKTSLVNLLPRIFDVTEGRILIDDIDIRQFRVSDLRRAISVVHQDVFLFHDTIFENIRCGKLDATREEILEAAKNAHALNFIEKLPQGWETIVGDRGQKLSGGERQRISIARAFLRNSPILILDEATSNLDSASEKIVQTALDALMSGKTTLVIAHRLSTVQSANQILVLQKGKIVERGNHQDLIQKHGEYAKFYSLFQENPTETF